MASDTPLLKRRSTASGGIAPFAALLFAAVPLLTASAALADVELPKAPVDSDYYYDGKASGSLLELGQKLFFDKLLSGNRNIACASCHHPRLGTGDALPLSIGEGAKGLGEKRDAGRFPDDINERVGRNAQPLFNVGAREFTRMFHDGRVEVSPHDPAIFLTPAGDELPAGLDNILAAQAMFPVLSNAEMAGQDGENPVARAVADQHLGEAWSLLARRLQRQPAYVQLFKEAFADIRQADDIRFVHAANAIAAFQAITWRADNSPFDRYLRGDKTALNAQQQAGMKLFYGRAGCASCHSGAFQTDHRFHAIAMPQIGPGKSHGFDGHEDFGREAVSGRLADRYRFRTPSLRNIELTGPWGHDGAFDTLRATVEHHLKPQQSLNRYTLPQTIRPYRPDLAATDTLVQNDPARRQRLARSSELDIAPLQAADIDALLAFLHALTDPASRKPGENVVPESVPSGLPVDR
ncbi:MAG TPA: cytochrome-c peroxidase [Thiotrichales bacterium]|nr:cytochrome-c peroxidase [Thiotrichales bacterium]